MTNTLLTSRAFVYGIRAIGRRSFVDDNPFILNEGTSLCVRMKLECIESVKYSSSTTFPSLNFALKSHQSEDHQANTQKEFHVTSKYSKKKST